MTDKVKAARERLRADAKEPSPGYFSAVYEGTDYNPDFDAWTLAHAYLAEHCRRHPEQYQDILAIMEAQS